jgi:hypothetical protein
MKIKERLDVRVGVFTIANDDERQAKMILNAERI